MGYMFGLHEVHTTSTKFILLCDSVTDHTDIREADVIMLNFSKTFYSLLHRNSHSPTMRIKHKYVDLQIRRAYGTLLLMAWTSKCGMFCYMHRVDKPLCTLTTQIAYLFIKPLEFSWCLETSHLCLSRIRCANNCHWLINLGKRDDSCELKDVSYKKFQFSQCINVKNFLREIYIL